MDPNTSTKETKTKIVEIILKKPTITNILKISKEAKNDLDSIFFT